MKTLPLLDTTAFEETILPIKIGNKIVELKTRVSLREGFAIQETITKLSENAASGLFDFYKVVLSLLTKADPELTYDYLQDNLDWAGANSLAKAILQATFANPTETPEVKE